MKKILSLTLGLLLIFGALALTVNFKPYANAETFDIVVNNFEELKSAFGKANSTNQINVTLACDIEMQSDLTLKGNINIKASNKQQLIFDYNGTKTGISLSKNSNIGLDNVTVTRRVANETERFLFYTYDKQVTLNFTDCVFDVATAEIASTSYDRIVYCSVENALTCYLNNCVFNTAGYFYRGTYVVFNCDNLPQSAGSAKVKDFTALKIDYQKNQITFPQGVTVSTDSEFTQTVKSGSKINSDCTYYALKEGFSFSFKTRNLKFETPTSASVLVDYANECVTFTSEYAVWANQSLTQAVSSGDKVVPGQKLYIVKLASGIFIQSDVYCMQLPLRPEKRELTADFVCYFGFVMQHVNNMEYRVNGGEWQKSPVFIGLNASTEYLVEMRVASTAVSFVSEIHSIKVKTSEQN